MQRLKQPTTAADTLFRCILYLPPPSLPPSRVLLKRFRVPRENPVSFQLGLVEREINEVLQGYLRWQKPTESGQSNQSSGSHATQKEVGPDDVCPICQDELLGRRQPLTYCKFGCGKSVHIKCMKIWAEHQRTNGEKTIRCPLCREDFGPLQVGIARGCTYF